MFEGFELATIETAEAAIRVRHGGSGPPLLLLHGSPQTHVMWHAVTPRLAQDFTVVAADLRGYGDSSKPPTAPDHEPYSKRAMARDQLAVMERLGFERFFVAGHDRGGRCAYRLALDHPERVLKLALLDIVPPPSRRRKASPASRSRASPRSRAPCRPPWVLRSPRNPASTISSVCCAVQLRYFHCSLNPISFSV